MLSIKSFNFHRRRAAVPPRCYWQGRNIAKIKMGSASFIVVVAAERARIMGHRQHLASALKSEIQKKYPNGVRQWSLIGQNIFHLYLDRKIFNFLDYLPKVFWFYLLQNFNIEIMLTKSRFHRIIYFQVYTIEHKQKFTGMPNFF